MTKYRHCVEKMLADNQQLFADFSRVHARYARDRHAWQAEFNRVGQQVQDIIREYENRLCAPSEKGQFSQFSANLAAKFQENVRQLFPLLDFIGVEITSVPQKPPAKSTADIWEEIKKISLS